LHGILFVAIHPLVLLPAIKLFCTQIVAESPTLGISIAAKQRYPDKTVDVRALRADYQTTFD
jgi:hypothetical protein